MQIAQRISSFLKKPFTGKRQNVLKAAKKSYDLTEKIVITLLFSKKRSIAQKNWVRTHCTLDEVKIEEMKKWHRQEKER